MWLPNRPDTDRPVQSQKRVRSLQFSISVEGELYYPCSESEVGADQLRSYCEAFGFAYADCWFYHEAAN